MNKLWVHLALTFSAVVVAGIALLMLIGQLSLAFAAPTFTAELAEPDRLVGQLLADYQRDNSWAAAASIIRAAEGNARSAPTVFAAFTLRDVDGTLIYASRLRNDNHVILPMGEIPLEVDGGVIGTLEIGSVERDRPSFLQRLTPGPSPPQAFFTVIAFVAGVVGISAGVLVSRMLTAPLEGLAEAARALSSDSKARAALGGTDEVREVAQAFNDMAEEIEEVAALRRQLVADVAHELRTPLNTMQGNLYAILDDVYPLTKEEIAGLYEQTRSLARIVDDLREVANAEAGKLSLHKVRLEVSALLRDAVEPFRETAEGKGVRVSLDAQADAFIAADRDRMLQVLRNLLSNALRHTPADGKIAVKACTDEQQVVLTITDTGEGIAPQHLPRIFERFYRADVARSRATGGTGIGLSIVKAIVEAHEGSVSVASEVDTGTTFTIRLPLLIPTTEDVPVVNA